MPDGELVLEGRVRGIRTAQSDPNQNRPNRNEGRRIKIKNCKWALSKEEITTWLEKYGSITVPISEETYEEDHSDNDEGEEELGTGSYWVSMKLSDPIPQFLPMHGKKVEIYYRGMQQLCVKCYQPGHKKMDCPNAKLEWMDYVCNFIMATEYDKEMFGRWYYIAKKHLRNKPPQQDGAKRRQETETETETIQSDSNAGVEHLKLAGGIQGLKVAGINTDGQATAMVDIPSNNWVRVASGGKASSPTKREQTMMKKDNAAWETLKGNDSGQAYRNSLAYKKNTAAIAAQNAIAGRTRGKNPTEKEN